MGNPARCDNAYRYRRKYNIRRLQKRSLKILDDSWRVARRVRFAGVGGARAGEVINKYNGRHRQYKYYKSAAPMRNWWNYSARRPHSDFKNNKSDMSYILWTLLAPRIYDEIIRLRDAPITWKSFGPRISRISAKLSVNRAINNKIKIRIRALVGLQRGAAVSFFFRINWRRENVWWR